MTHAGTRLFWFSSFASRFFFAFDFLLIVAVSIPRLHKCVSLWADRSNLLVDVGALVVGKFEQVDLFVHLVTHPTHLLGTAGNAVGRI